MDSSQNFSCLLLLQIKVRIAKGTRKHFLKSFYFQYFLTVEIGLSDTWWHSVTDDTAHKAEKGSKTQVVKIHLSAWEKEKEESLWVKAWLFEKETDGLHLPAWILQASGVQKCCEKQH